MKVAAKVSLLTALFAAAAIVAACAAVYAACRTSVLDAQLHLAKDAYTSWCEEFAGWTAAVPRAEYSAWVDRIALRYYAEQVPGSAAYAVYADDTVVSNNTGIDALQFIAKKGRPVPFDENLRYGYAQSANNVVLVLGAGTRSEALQVFLVRDVTETWTELSVLGSLCIVAGSGAVIVCAICIFWAVRQMLRPLDDVRATMSAVASGRYDEPIPEQTGTDEFAQLTRDCGLMAQAISDKVEQLGLVAEERRLLLSAVAHEMRTPVTAVAGLARTVQSLSLPEERRTALLGLIHDESLRLERLCTKLTALLSADSKPIETGTVLASDFASMLDSAASAAAGTADLIIETEKDACWNVDADLLRTAVLNLIDNARKAGATKIHAELGRDAISVADNGCGIPKELLEEVRKPFVKADASRSSEGFGLGLALVDRIMTAHGGRVALQSSPGHGTRIELQIPALLPSRVSNVCRRQEPDS